MANFAGRRSPLRVRVCGARILQSPGLSVRQWAFRLLARSPGLSAQKLQKLQKVAGTWPGKVPATFFGGAAELQIIHTIGTAVQGNLAAARSGLSGMFKKLTVLGLTLGLAGCESSPTVACTAIAQAGLDVSVINELNGQGVCDATVTAVEGDYRESLPAFSCRFVGAYERTGTYTLRAQRTGYATKEVVNVRVTMATGDCPHVETVRMQIRLVPLAVTDHGTDLPGLDNRYEDVRREPLTVMNDVDGLNRLYAGGIGVPDIRVNRQPLPHASGNRQLNAVTSGDHDTRVTNTDRELDRFVRGKRSWWARILRTAVTGTQRSVRVGERES